MSRFFVGRSWQEHGVLGAHVLVRLCPGQGLLLSQPGCLHVLLDLLECRHAPGNYGIDKDEVPAEAGFYRPLPGTGREFLDGLRELRPEFLAEELRRPVAIVVLEHEGVGEGFGELRILWLAGELLQGSFSVGAGTLAASVRRKIKMPEAYAVGLGELVAILLIPGFEFCCSRFASGGHRYVE